VSTEQNAAGRTRWRALLQDSGDRLFDRYLGIETASVVDYGDLEFDADTGGYYQASNWLNLVKLHQVLRGWHVTKDDAFIDFGCGKGQVLALASRFPFGRVIGLDLSPSLIRIAERNAARIRGRAKCGAIELVEMNALDFPIPDDLTVAYFYMPFPTPVFERVVANIEESIARRPRLVRIVYLFQAETDLPVPGQHGFHKVMEWRRMMIYANDTTAGADA
jgi:SAM-dependent methyltransferase